MVRQKAFKGKHKISDRWENIPYVVLSQTAPDVPVYKVRQQNGNDT